MQSHPAQQRLPLFTDTPTEAKFLWQIASVGKNRGYCDFDPRQTPTGAIPLWSERWLPGYCCMELLSVLTLFSLNMPQWSTFNTMLYFTLTNAMWHKAPEYWMSSGCIIMSVYCQSATRPLLHGHGTFLSRILETSNEGERATNPNPLSPSIPARTRQRALVDIENCWSVYYDLVKLITITVWSTGQQSQDCLRLPAGVYVHYALYIIAAGLGNSTLLKKNNENQSNRFSLKKYDYSDRPGQASNLGTSVCDACPIHTWDKLREIDILLNCSLPAS